MSISPNDLQKAIEAAFKNVGLVKSDLIPDKSVDLKTGLEGFKSKFADLGSSLTNLKDSINQNFYVWRDLSKTGAAFSNDLVGMSLSATQTRMSLKDFSDVVRENGKYMTGLGGSVGRGAEVFAKLSKDFFDSNVDKNLRNLGYTSKELNEVLAFTAGAQKSSFQDTEDGRKRTQTAAAAMAKEMDLIAKLTGKSRQEQMEEMTKRRVDGQVESKLRLLTQGKTDAEAAQIRIEYEKGRQEAIKQGTEQSYKEFFATGTYLTEGAATQRALLGKQIELQEQQISAIQRGDATKAADLRIEQQAEMMKNQNDRTLMLLGTLGSAAGPAGEAIQKTVEINDAFYQAVTTIKKEYESQSGSMKSWSEVIVEARKRIDQEQRGKDKTGKEVMSGATEGFIALERAQQDFKSGLAGLALATNDAKESIAGELRNAGKIVKDTLDGLTGAMSNFSKVIEEKAQLGLTGKSPTTRADGSAIREMEERQARGGAIGTAATAGLEATKTLTKALDKLSESFTTYTTIFRPSTVAPAVPASRYKGSIGETGQLFENWGSGTMVELHGIESVMRPEDLENIVQNSIKGFNKGIDLSQIPTNISTTFSNITESSYSNISNNVIDDLNTALEETETYINDELTIITDSREKITEMRRKASDQEILDEQARILETAELHKTVIGKSVKDMSDEAIEALLPIGTKLGDFYVGLDDTLQSFANDSAVELKSLMENESSDRQLIERITSQIQKNIPAPITGYEQDGPGTRLGSPGISAPITGYEQDGPGTRLGSPGISAPITGYEQDGPGTIAASKINLNKYKIPGIDFGTMGKEPPKGAIDGGLAAAAAEATAKNLNTLDGGEAAAAIDAKKAAENAVRKATETPVQTIAKATLDDVVKSLDRLNIQMGQLISQQADLIRKQTSSMISTLSNNVYDKTA
jgi:hypothetical protein